MTNDPSQFTPVSGEVMWAEVCSSSSRRTLTHESADALLSIVREAAVRRPKVLVLTGNSEAWCLGGDVAVFASVADREAYIDELATRVHAVVSGLHELESIVLTVVDGVAAGAGMPLVAAADIILASNRARFTLGHTKLGLTPDGGTSLLSASVGVHRLLYAALVNPVLDAVAAQQYGLVAEVVPPGGLLSRARELAELLAAGSAQSLTATKRLIRRRAMPRSHDALAREQKVLRRAAATADAAEGIRAFLDKRPAQFPGA